MTKRDKELGERVGGYSKDAYRSWPACVAMLRRHGLDDLEIEAVLRSKWTRWAGDMAARPSHGYGSYTAKDLEVFMNAPGSRSGNRWAEVKALTRETFGSEAAS